MGVCRLSFVLLKQRINKKNMSKFADFNYLNALISKSSFGNVGITFREILHEAQSDYTSDLVSIRQLLIIKYCTY